MLERYFSKPDTLDRIHAAWLGENIRRYVTSLHEQRYAARSIQRRVPVLMHLSEFTQAKGVKASDELPSYVEPFRQLLCRPASKRSSNEKPAGAPDFCTGYGPSLSWGNIAELFVDDVSSSADSVRGDGPRLF